MAVCNSIAEINNMATLYLSGSANELMALYKKNIENKHQNKHPQKSENNAKGAIIKPNKGP